MVFVTPGTQPGRPLNHHYPASAVLVGIDALWHQSGATFELVFRRACSSRANLNAGRDLLQTRALMGMLQVAFVCVSEVKNFVSAAFCVRSVTYVFFQVVDCVQQSPRKLTLCMVQ